MDKLLNKLRAKLRIRGHKVILRWFDPPESLLDQWAGKTPFVRMELELARIPVVGDVISVPYRKYCVLVTKVELFTEKHSGGTVARIFADTIRKR